MNTNFKPLGIVAAVAAASAGYVGTVNAQTGDLAAETDLGDLAIVPYYTVQEGYATGVNVINTSARTQALKIRFRRARDSMDALDFNVVLSPNDMYTGFVQASGEDIKFISNDNSCTAPAYPAGGFVMPDIYREGAETGYIEILSMGSPASETSAVALAAKHDATGVPADCAGVRDNFFRNRDAAGNANLATRGVISSGVTHQFVRAVSATTPVPNVWEEAPNSLKVSYFIKSDETGVEFGDNAVHVENYLDGPAMTNQQLGTFDGDLCGFDHPDLLGGAPEPACAADGATSGVAVYDSLRVTLGAQTLINDWSANSAGDFSVDTDWVVTIPGQYLMFDQPFYQFGLDTGLEVCTRGGTTITGTGTGLDGQVIPPCDFRDIPMTAQFTVYDREEQGIVVEEGDLVVSPQPPTDIPTDVLDKEVNVIQWGSAPVLNAPEFIEVPKPDGARFGWTSLAATSAPNTQVCEYNTAGIVNPLAALLGYDIPAMACTSVTSPAPMIGFVAWQRNFAALPAANYGRIVAHSRTQSS
ncbi:hypothetical protein F0M18_03630 [Pseudohalioglobus sediminis]|uniref:Uncharacterized protein n=1 Tax=Pseudohalioglobus sediminis TaxID=2606449 RepID=A0A5B0X7F7_9GAMM|nr:hypothetical protein [Pseudohalioglobus sediminis]KAA1194528.1 hypothetical protein F0M18_03630 [Pseudohalioglobus sediminis]